MFYEVSNNDFGKYNIWTTPITSFEIGCCSQIKEMKAVGNSKILQIEREIESHIVLNWMQSSFYC